MNPENPEEYGINERPIPEKLRDWKTEEPRIGYDRPLPGKLRDDRFGYPARLREMMIDHYRKN
jgi:hypothetical protein